jgi:glycosyltransferase involved in cell wall biosynthesis
VRILVSAYGCEPDKGSEQGVGWNWCLQLAGLAELVVITRANNAKAIEAALPRSFLNKVRFEFYDPPSVVRWLKRRERGLYPFYLCWQWGAYRRARLLVRQEQFDYVMHLTFGSIWLPSFMHRLGLPFIWGPLGGGEAVPFHLIRCLTPRGQIAQYLRYLLMRTSAVNPLLAGLLRRSQVILTRTADTARLIPARYRSKVRVVLETAMSEELLTLEPVLQDRSDSRQLQVVYTGRLVPFKHVEAALHAFARARARGADLRFVIVGDGPSRSSLESLAFRLAVDQHVFFRGSVSSHEVVQELARSHIYLFPSLREGGVWSLMEAMSVGLPVICIDASGMATITDDTCAVRVPPTSQEQIIEGLAAALVHLAGSPEEREKLGRNARRRIEQHFRWEHKGRFMRSLFAELEEPGG